jgi:hypothetical protein
VQSSTGEGKPGGAALNGFDACGIAFGQGSLRVGDELLNRFFLLIQLRLHDICILLVALAPLQRLLGQLIIALLNRQLRTPVPIILPKHTSMTRMREQ